MSKHFELLDFLRRAPKPLLGECFSRLSIAEGLFLTKLKRGSEGEIAGAMEALAVADRDRVIAAFRRIWDLHGREFTKGILNEAQFHDDQAAYETLLALSHLA